MKKSVKALLWSALVFPGVGHFYLKRHRRGMIMFVPGLIGISLYIRGVFQQAEYVLDKLQDGTVAPDPVAIAAMLDNVPESQLANIAFWVFVLCWVAGMVDSYLVGEQIAKDEKNTASPKLPT